MPTQTLRIKCPHCGWIRKIELDVPAGRSDIVAGTGDFLQRLGQDWREKIKEARKDRELDEANNWLPMPDCPNCEKPYEYNVETRQTR